MRLIDYGLAQRATKVLHGCDPTPPPSLWDFERASDLLASLEEAGLIVVLDGIGEATASARCPMCGIDGSHVHSGMERVCYRNGIKASAEVDASQEPAAVSGERADQ